MANNFAIEFDDLRLLLEIAECGSFSQAAARRRWSQPQVSQRIGALEQQVGAQLFRRHRRGAMPTEACVAFMPSARAALAALDAGRLAVKGAPALPNVTLACLPSLASTVFGALLPALAGAPLEIRCTTDHSPIIMDMLLTDRAQLGFVLNCPAVAGIRLERLCLSPIVAVVRRGHPLAQATTLAAVANAQLAPQYWGSECDTLIALLRAHRTVTQPIHTIQPSSAALELALEHGFLTFMPEMAVARQLRTGQLQRLALTDLPRWEWELMVAWRSGKRPDVAKETVLQQVRALAKDWTAPPL
ncbi:MAG: LysR family transcriptional regulator [Burkholderiaceae bacterium]|nr:LysR family transcriptional regulator [Burkholderiaceae bacterium]